MKFLDMAIRSLDPSLGGEFDATGFAATHAA